MGQYNYCPAVEGGTVLCFLLPNCGRLNCAVCCTALQWKVGQRCQAVFWEDEQLYDAVIKSIDGESCVVMYSGYGNEEQQKLADLLPPDHTLHSHHAGGDTPGAADLCSEEVCANYFISHTCVHCFI